MFIRAAEKKSYDVLNMNGVIDSHFIGLLERKFEKTKWARVDSDTVDKLIVKAEEAKVEEVEATEGEDGKKKTKKKKPAELVLTEEQENKLKETFTKVITREGMHVQVDKLGKDQLPILLTRPEFMRRMKEMAAMGGGGMAYMGEMPETINVVVNTQHPLVQNIIDQEDGSELAKQLYDLALLSQNLLEGKDLTDFIHRSVEMLQKG